MENLLKEILKKLSRIEKRMKRLEDYAFYAFDDESDFLISEPLDEEYIYKAVKKIGDKKEISVSILQKILSIDLNLAIKLLSELEEKGLIIKSSTEGLAEVNTDKIKEYLDRGKQKKWN